MNATRRLLVETLPPSPAFSRWVLVFIAGSHLVFGAAHLSIDYVWHPLLWSAAFFFAAACCVNAAWRFHSLRSVAVAGAATTVAYMSRACALVFGQYMSGSCIDGAQLVIATTLWVTLTGLAFVLFARGMGPLSSIYRRQHLGREGGTGCGH